MFSTAWPATTLHRCIVLLALMLMPVSIVRGQVFADLDDFNGSSNGANPSGSLVQGTDGNYYGTTFFGGESHNGTVFMITPAGTFTELYSFNGYGVNPNGLVYGSDGNFYGTTELGGGGDDGTVFKITPVGVLSHLHAFAGVDGNDPRGSLIMGNDGNFYGTTLYGGVGSTEEQGSGNGTVFMISPGGVLTSLHSFTGPDGEWPVAGLVQGSDGNFYGTTQSGGETYTGPYTGYGTVFRITPAGVLTTLHSFSGSDGWEPVGPMVEGSDGNFYGTTYLGIYASGTVFRITPSGVLTTLHSFNSTDGAFPNSGLIQGRDGNFYGTTYAGGTSSPNGSGYGTVFQVTPEGIVTTLHSFIKSDGDDPNGLVQGSDGTFYGTTQTGGLFGKGTIFTLNVPPAPAAPTNLTATADDSQILLSWTASTGATSYSVYRGTAAGSESTTAIGTSPTMAYTDSGLDNGTTYYYTVYAVSGGVSPVSNEAHATPEPLAPAVPTGLTATAGDALVALAWNASPFATTYSIYRSTTSGGEGTIAYQSGLTTTTYTDTGVANGKTYYYTVTAVNSAGSSAQSSEVSSTPMLPIPSTPGGLTATAGNAEVTLTWNASALATSYNVYRSTTSGGEGSTAYQTDITTTAYTDSGATNGTTYYYTITAVNGSGASPQSGEVSGTPMLPVPAAPGGLTAVAGNAQVALIWNASGLATSYSVYRSTTSGGEGPTAYQTGIMATSYTDTGLINGTTYYYTVAAVNGSGASPQSGEVSGTPMLPVPAAPGGLTATAGDAQVTLNWNASALATSYNVYRSTTSGDEASTAYQIGLTTSSYTDTGLINGMTYYYTVAAANSSGISAESSEVNGSPMVPIPTTPSGLAATAGNAQVTLDWDISARATSYNIYRSATSGGEGSTAYQTGITTTAYVDADLINGITYYYTVAAVNPGGTAAQSAEVSAMPEPPTLHSFSAGLQMISAPVDDSAFSLSQIFDVPNVTLAVWDASDLNYVLSPTSPADTMRPGQGYWVRFASTADLLVAGPETDPTQAIDIPLSPGWNMIGDPRTVPVSMLNVVVLVGASVVGTVADAIGDNRPNDRTGITGLIGPKVYTYQPGDTQYESQPAGGGTLSPFVGYWIYAGQACTLEFNSNVPRGAHLHLRPF